MDSRKRRPSLFDVDAATLALLNESSDDDSTDSEEEPCMHNDEEDDILLSEYGESDNNVSSDFDDLDLMSDSDTENSSSETHSDDSDQTFGSNPTVPDPTWHSRGSARSRFPFNGNPGLKVNVQDTEDPISFFELYFDDALINLIVQQTNLYAQQVIAEKDGRLKKRSRMKEWKETDADEIKLYLAMLLLQGIVRKPKKTLYFSKKSSLNTPFFRRIFSCDRFLLLSKFLHFTNNDDTEDVSSVPQKLVKLWPVLQHIKNKFSSVYVPEEHVSIDESLMLWKGRLSWKQYIPSKRARYGIKSYEICESSTGYIWDFFVYTGKSTEYNSAYENESSVGAKAILTLAHDLLDKGYCISMDNFFSSTHLFDLLCSRSTDAVGTVRANSKGLPKKLMKKKLNKGDVAAMYKDKLMALRWRDKKCVQMLSTIHDATTVEVESRGKTKQKPKVCVDYNDRMGGVDLSDAYLASYPSARKRMKKYYKKQFRHILDMATFNAFILYKKCGGEMSRLTFILTLVDRIVEKHHSLQRQMKPGRPSREQNPLRLTERHFPDFIPSTSSNPKPTRRCHVCYSHKPRKQTHFMCNQCDKALCAAPCFQIYHTIKNY